ncbi:MAG TPA: 30S ribosomal protein S12 methylthiotransferase RimO [Phycisphaerae bacterium]|nr:30S ribosomal protein S12 methylthiotransferase RimO [Phycisphaerae bacterium]
MAEARQPIAALVSLGCPKNLVDSERMLAGLALAGFAVTNSPDGADVAVVNTCAFIDLARAETDEAIEELEALKRAGRLGRIVVAGCMAQRDGPAVLARHAGVDAVAGLAERDALADVCRAALARSAKQAPAVRVGPFPAAAPDDRERLRLTPRHYAYLRITEGCDNRCAYCAIPAIRGPLRSKSPDAVLAEAQELVADGARELVLVGQDTTAFGRDRGDGWNLARLLARLRRESGAEWIRLMYTHPASFTDDVIQELARGLPIVPYVDLPIQHISDAILASMGRRITRAGVERLLGRLREAVPGIAIRTTFIVGYPGETGEAFEELADFLEKVRFDHVGSFLYSPETGTRAANLPDQVPPEVRRRRWDRLMRLSERLAHEAARRMVGRRITVRVDGPAHAAGYLAARHGGQAPEVDSVVLLPTGTAKQGDEVKVRIVAAKGYDTVAAATDGDPEA